MTGSSRRFIPTLTAIWASSAPPTPAQMKLPSISSLRPPTAKVRMTRAISTPSTTMQPTKPKALPTQLKIKSLWALGTL